MTAYIMPAAILFIVAFGLYKQVPVFEKFVEGAKDGLKIAISLAPTLVGLLTAVAMFSASGAIDLLSHSLKPLLSAVGIPADIIPLAILRPISGSGSISIFTSIIEKLGPDSTAGRMAAVILSSTETTFYTIAIYFGSCGIKKSGITLPAALIADFSGFVFSALSVNLFF